MVSPRFLKSYGWLMLGITSLTRKTLLIFCSSYFTAIAIRSSGFSCLHPQFFAFSSYSFASYHKDKRTSHTTLIIFVYVYVYDNFIKNYSETFQLILFSSILHSILKTVTRSTLEIKWLVSTCNVTLR